MSSSYHSKVRDLLKTRQSCFSFVWDMNFSIIFPYLGEAKVSTANSDLTNFVDINPIQDDAGGGRGARQKGPPTSFSPVTYTNVRISPQNFLNFSFNPFDRLV